MAFVQSEGTFNINSIVRVWCLTPLSTRNLFFTKLVGLSQWCLKPISKIFLLYHGGQFYWWRKLEHPEKTLPHNVVSSTPRLSGAQTHKVSI